MSQAATADEPSDRSHFLPVDARLSKHPQNMMRRGIDMVPVHPRPTRPIRRVNAVAASVAFSRVYTGVHYPSDVAVGWVMGRIAAHAVTLVSRRLYIDGS
jgi:hypothetical protein